MQYMFQEYVLDLLSFKVFSVCRYVTISGFQVSTQIQFKGLQLNIDPNKGLKLLTESAFTT